MLFLPRIGRTSTRQKGTGAQTITVIMENHVLLSRRRPADWLTAGARRGSCTSNRKTRRGVEGGEATRRRKEGKKKRQRGEGSSLLLDKLSHLRLHILPLSGSFTVSSSLLLLRSPRSPFTPVEAHRLVRSMTTNPPGDIG